MSVSEFKLDSGTGCSLHIALFCSVQNTKQLKEMLLSGKLECCLIKPSLILDPFQIIVAANKAIISERAHKLSTRSLFTEVLLNLSISKNINQSLKTFGIDGEEKEIMVVVFEKGGDRVTEKILDIVSGNLCPLDQLKTFSDLTAIKKLYNVKEEEMKVSPLLDSIVSRISAKDILGFKL